MRLKINFFFIFFLFVIPLPAQLIYLDFDSAMQRNRYESVIADILNQEKLGSSGQELYSFFSQLYAINNFIKITPAAEPLIPKVIHQIWIGEKIPEKFKQFRESWLHNHPDWHYHLWTQADLEKEAWQNYDLIQQSRNPGEISDLMRYEILYKYGGVYIDFDFECLQQLDELNRRYHCYVGIQPLDSGLVQLGIGIIGACPHHPLLHKVITLIRTSWPIHTGNAPARTGPLLFTRAFFAFAGKHAEFIDIAFPAFYFYPLNCCEKNLYPEIWRAMGAFGIHHWAKSWLLPAFRKKDFQQLE